MPRRRVTHTTSLKERIAERAKAIATKAGTLPLGSKERDRMERRARQASTGSDRPILLHYDTKLGHAGGKPVSKQIDDFGVELTFLFWQLGVNAPAGALSETR